MFPNRLPDRLGQVEISVIIGFLFLQIEVEQDNPEISASDQSRHLLAADQAFADQFVVMEQIREGNRKTGAQQVAREVTESPRAARD